MTKALAAIFGEVHATDVSGEMISRARERLSTVENVHFYETNGYDLSELPDEHFDIVLSAFVFQHIPIEEIIRSNLSEALRVLRPDGILRFQTNSLTTFGFQEIENDTWLGLHFPSFDSRIRQEQRYSTDGIAGCGTRDCWTTLLKAGPAERQALEVKPTIEWHTGAGGSTIILPTVTRRH
jgi:ubiquinone/menaquinone biosynthesis C-methylase UbiE